MMNVLVTGGAGYIGSHVVEELQKNGFTPIVYDNLSTGHAAAVPEEVQLVEGDIHDVAFLKHIMAQFEIDAVIHFAASSLVGESMENPSKYYFNNVEGSLHLLEAMKGAGVDYIVFSSTAAVYGEPESVPIKEDSCLNPTNVYGRTKLMIEKMLADYDMAYEMRYVALRYFNAAGASPSRDIGEDHDPESHLIPLVLKTAQGVRRQLPSMVLIMLLQTVPVCVIMFMSATWQRHMFWHSSICWLEERAACIIWAVKMVSACARSSMLLKRLRG